MSSIFTILEQKSYILQCKCLKAELPLIYFPQKSGNAYRQALDAAWEIANSLDKIIDQKI